MGYSLARLRVALRDRRGRRPNRVVLANALGLPDAVHAASLRRPAGARVPRRSRRLSDPRRGDRLPEQYAATLELPVELNSPVRSLTAEDGGSSSSWTKDGSTPTRSSSRPGPSRCRGCPRSRPLSPGDLSRTAPATGDRATSRGGSSSSVAATPASRSRRSCRRRTGCTRRWLAPDAAAAAVPRPRSLLVADEDGSDQEDPSTRASGAACSDRDTLGRLAPARSIERHGVELRPRAVGGIGANAPVRRRQPARRGCR